jgi:hypothetical protein
MIERNLLFSREALRKARRDAYSAFTPEVESALVSPGSAEHTAFLGSLGLLNATSELLTAKVSRDNFESQGKPIPIQLGRFIREGDQNIRRYEEELERVRRSYLFTYSVEENPYSRALRSFQNGYENLIADEAAILSLPYTWAFGSNFRGISHRSVTGMTGVPTMDEIRAFAMSRVSLTIGKYMDARGR